jgi:uncharacterized protein
MQAENVLKYVVSFLVENPDQVNVRQVEGEKNSILELMVAESDIGKVIGRNGRIAKSLRTLVSAASAKEGKSYTLEIVD